MAPTALCFLGPSILSLLFSSIFCVSIIYLIFFEHCELFYFRKKIKQPLNLPACSFKHFALSGFFCKWHLSFVFHAKSHRPKGSKVLWSCGAILSRIACRCCTYKFNIFPKPGFVWIWLNMCASHGSGFIAQNFANYAEQKILNHRIEILKTDTAPRACATGNERYCPHPQSHSVYSIHVYVYIHVTMYIHVYTCIYIFVCVYVPMSLSMCTRTCPWMVSM